MVEPGRSLRARTEVILDGGPPAGPALQSGDQHLPAQEAVHAYLTHERLAVNNGPLNDISIVGHDLSHRSRPHGNPRYRPRYQQIDRVESPGDRSEAIPKFQCTQG